MRVHLGLELALEEAVDGKQLAIVLLFFVLYYGLPQFPVPLAMIQFGTCENVVVGKPCSPNSNGVVVQRSNLHSLPIGLK